MSYSQVILVDEHDREIGVMDKLQAHKEGRLHRAFSIMVFNTKGEMLIHKRANNKYHSPGLWTNACCSHPQPLEDTNISASKRLEIEMGIKAKVRFAFSFIYETDFMNGLTENELDYVFIAETDDLPVVNPEEVSDWKYLSMEDLVKDIRENPDNYTYWFKIIINQYTPALVVNG